MTKYIFVTGGVTSSLGKGIIAASLGKLLQARGLSVTIQKFDPYINIDPGTLNPYEHGECYVTNDGAETDLDLGHYERFLSIETSQANNVTTGRIYYNVIQKERQGEFLGKTVQVIPHITDEIKNNIYKLGETGKYDVVITEIGGCVGDIESLPFVEAVRQARFELGPTNSISIHLTLIPYLKASGELKTKPTQHSVKELLEAGIQPDILVCRSEYPITQEIRKKLALFCNVPINSVIEALDASTIYDVPILMRKEKLDERVLTKFKMPYKKEPKITKWKEFLGRLKNPTASVNIGLVGKYVELQDAYRSIAESFIHAGAANECKVNVNWIHAEELDGDNVHKSLGGLDGILVAPGFGERGIEGKIYAVQYARENKIPFFGICLGMQCAVIEFARNVLGKKKANSKEMANYFEQVVEQSGCEAKQCANWVVGDLSAFLNKNNLDITESKVNTEQLAGMLQRITDKTISGKIAKKVFAAMWDGEGDADTIIDKNGWKQVTDSGAIEKIIDEVISNNPSQVEEYRGGKEKVFGFFVGQVMKASKGKANPKQVNELLKQKLA